MMYSFIYQNRHTISAPLRPPDASLDNLDRCGVRSKSSRSSASIFSVTGAVFGCSLTICFTLNVSMNLLK